MTVNARRAEWAGEAIDRFADITGRRNGNSSDQEILNDLLCDLMHWADRSGSADFEQAYAMGRMFYEEELEEEDTPQAKAVRMVRMAAKRANKTA